MPSKRKKNKRRMRRVQAQRRALEEQHAANPPIKASPGTAVSAPPTTTPTKVPEPASPPSENKPRVIPITVPVVQTPKVEPQPAVKEPVAEPVQAEVTTKEPDVELLLQVPAEVEVEIHPEVEAEAHITEAPLVGWTPPVESVTDEAGVGQEAELDVPEPEPVNETVDVVSIPETEQTHDVRAPEAEILSEEVTEDKVELEVAVTEDVSVPEHVREPSEDPAVEDLSNHVSAEAEAAADVADGSMVAAVAERPELEQESPSPAASIQEEVLEDAAAEEAPVLSAGIPEQVKEAEVSETKEEVDDVTARAWPAEGALTASAVIQQEFIIAGTESRDVSPAAAAPPEDEVSSNSAEQTSLSASSEEPKTEACDATCLIQLPVKSVQLGSVVNQPGNFSGNSSEWTHCSRSFN
ncbi:transcript variant X4 [Nothobranchius furzeri]|uniref:Transcript variant X4 n=1 Tax=Nothobranchius furzeri TaxID=105023 RepID=A0A9D2XF19_NOTFU|nr:transcript variant X4 [Nothobranchius furzeri]